VGSKVGDILAEVLQWSGTARAALVPSTNSSVITSLLEPTTTCPNKDPKAKPPRPRQEAERGGRLVVFSKGEERSFDFLTAMFGSPDPSLVRVVRVVVVVVVVEVVVVGVVVGSHSSFFGPASTSYTSHGYGLIRSIILFPLLPYTRLVVLSFQIPSMPVMSTLCVPESKVRGERGGG